MCLSYSGTYPPKRDGIFQLLRRSKICHSQICLNLERQLKLFKEPN